MEVIVQHTETKWYCGAKAYWVRRVSHAAKFADPVAALTFCLRKNLRSVRLVWSDAATDRESCIYPFGGDPVAKAELKSMRKAIRESQELKRERRLIQARMGALLAAGKEVKKHFPFRREVRSVKFRKYSEVNKTE